MQPQLIRETKVALDGRSETFECMALRRSHSLAMVRFDHPAERHTGGFFFPAGSYTIGFFWVRRSYNCYRFTGPDDRVIAYRFDVVDRVSIRPGHIRYRDLLLDLWVSPAGAITVEDEEDVTAAAADGLLNERQLAAIERTRALVVRESARIIAECEALISQFA
jgi:predicted RNA-binding protein associated with RNAse of E/G family